MFQSSDWDESWNEYNHYLFTLDEDFKILGTFFSKTEFKYNHDNDDDATSGDNLIIVPVGSNIMYLSTNKNDYDYKKNQGYENDSVKYLFNYVTGTIYNFTGKLSMVLIEDDANNPYEIKSENNDIIKYEIKPENDGAEYGISDSQQKKIISEIISNSSSKQNVGFPQYTDVPSKKQIGINYKPLEYIPVTVKSNLMTKIQGNTSNNTKTTRDLLNTLLKKTTSGGNVDEHTDSDKIMNIDDIKTFIKLYIEVINSIIYSPVFYKLTSLKCNEFNTIFTGLNLFTGQKEEDILKKLTIDDVKQIYINLINFMYIDISTLDENIDTVNLLKLFVTNENEQMYKKYIENYSILIGNITTQQPPITIVYISEFINLLSLLIDNDNLNRNISSGVVNLYDTILNIINVHAQLLPIIKNEYIKYFELDLNKNFRDTIDKFINEINENNIITYLKLRNDQFKEKKYNDRFSIKISKDTTKPQNIMIDYMDDNFPYYKLVKNNVGKDYILSDEIKNEVSKLEIENNLVETAISSLETELKIEPKTKHENKEKYNLIEDDLNTVIIDKYNYNYLFGPFTNLFKPEMNNENIAINMNSIIKKMEGGKPIFMIGYGASGAGKTASLIYLNNEGIKQDGILLHLCNIFGDKGYTNIQVKCKEFYSVGKYDKNTPPKIITVPQSGTINFEYKKGDDDTPGNFVLFDDYNHKNIHKYRFKSDEKSMTQEIFKGTNNIAEEKNIAELKNKINTVALEKINEDIAQAKPEKNDDKYDDKHDDKDHDKNNDDKDDDKNNGGGDADVAAATLGEVIIHMIDADRFVKATTNNPNSSRSHTLVFVKLIKPSTGVESDKEPKELNIIVGDFAGVENAFACENPETIREFINVKRDNFKENGKEVPYYSTEITSVNTDPIDDKSAPVQVNTECVEPLKSKEDLYDFNNPVIRESWSLSKPDIENLQKSIVNGITRLKFYMDFIQKYGRNENNDLNIESLTTNLKELKTNIGNLINNDIIYGILSKDSYIMDENTIDELQKSRDYFIQIMIKTKVKYERKKKNENNTKKLNQAIKYIQDLEKEYYLNYIDNDMLGLIKSELIFKTDVISKITDAIDKKKYNEDIIEEIGRLRQFDTQNEAGANFNLFDAYASYDENGKNILKEYKKSLDIILDNTTYKHKGKLTPKSTFDTIIQGELNYDKIKKAPEYKEFKVNYANLTNYINTTIETNFENLKKHTERMEILKAFADSFYDQNSSIESIELFKQDKKNTVNGEFINDKLIELLQPIITLLKITYTNLRDFLDFFIKSKVNLNELIDDMIHKILPQESNREIIEQANKEIGDTKKIKEIVEEEVAAIVANRQKKAPAPAPAVRRRQKGGSSNDVDLFTKVKKLETETKCRIDNSKLICENRRNEGYFINDSLEEIREVIKRILFEKNKDSINISPNFVDICLKNYCPQGSNCFKFDVFSEPNKKTTGSVIFDEIYNYLKLTGDTQYTIEKMYQDIIVSIFCVFNISRGANNPPPTPYLDINRLKLLYYYEDILNEKKQEFIKESEKIIEMIDIKFADKTNGLKLIVNEKGVSIFDNFKTKVKSGFTTSGKNFQTLYNDSYETKIQEFIDMIDKNNAVSSIGTLEFLDQIAKFNTVKTVCNTSDTDFVPDNLRETFMHEMKSLY
jgi:hypothetical protein